MGTTVEGNWHADMPRDITGSEYIFRKNKHIKTHTRRSLNDKWYNKTTLSRNIWNVLTAGKRQELRQIMKEP